MDRLALAFTFFGWAGWHLVSKCAMRYISPSAALIVSSVCAAVLLPVYWFTLGKSPETKFNLPGVAWIVVAYVVATAATFAYSYALTVRPVSSCALWTAGYPAMTCLLAIPIFGESFTFPKFIGLAFVIVGLVIVSASR